MRVLHMTIVDISGKGKPSKNFGGTFGATEKELTPAYNDCKCDCHRLPGVYHVMACCAPPLDGTSHAIFDAAALESVKVRAGVGEEPYDLGTEPERSPSVDPSEFARHEVDLERDAHDFHTDQDERRCWIDIAVAEVSNGATPAQAIEMADAIRAAFKSRFVPSST
jgi:hypothetical protein